MNLQRMQRLVIDALEDVKAQDIKVFNTSHLTGLFDRVMIASAASNRQARAISSHVVERAKAKGLEVIAIEGYDAGEWILVDLGDIVLHVMQPAMRQFYHLEELWGDKPVRVKLLPQSTLPATGMAAQDGWSDGTPA